jgi:hypothetical protein
VNADLLEIVLFFFQSVYCIGEILVDDERDREVTGVYLQPECDVLVERRELLNKNADGRGGGREEGTFDELIRHNGGVFAAL